MVAALPRNIQLKLQQTLAQWRRWSCEPALCAQPSAVKILTTGLSNFSVLVESSQRFVVRIDGEHTAMHNLNRPGEWRNLQAAHRAGLAPGPRYFNPELGALVCDYLEPDDQQPLVISEVARLLQAIHHLPARHHRLDLHERMLSYEKRLSHRAPDRAALLAPYRESVGVKLARAEAGKSTLVLCHHDLLRANRLYCGGRLFAIDWEYAAMSDPWYELAVVIAGDSLCSNETEELLLAYLGRTVREEEQQRVQDYGSAYRYLELLWYLSQDHPALDDEQLRHKLAGLDKSLN